MNFIKEPKGVDFIIQSPPLTDQERKEISDFIASRKSKTNAVKKIAKGKTTIKK
ncbi:hypothetical protein [Flavobacterium ginsengiterrae]|uniref:Uncharacterized protein n=1 Tax=Flavobacterium ginsengiterrae TaxID=871695 RepID=A0ABP7G321_9FLAO